MLMALIGLDLFLLGHGLSSTMSAQSEYGDHSVAQCSHEIKPHWATALLTHSPKSLSAPWSTRSVNADSSPAVIPNPAGPSSPPPVTLPKK